MNTATKKYKVTIWGEPYALVSDESNDLIQNSAELVDNYIKSFVLISPNADHKKIAVMAALKLACDLLSTQNQLAAQTTEYAKIADLIDRVL